MKKFLTFLGSISLISPSLSYVVACNNTDNRKDAKDYIENLDIGKIDKLTNNDIINKFLALNKGLEVGPVNHINCEICNCNTALIDCLHTNYWKHFNFLIKFEWALRDNYYSESNDIINIQKNKDDDSVSWEFDNLRDDYDIENEGKFSFKLDYQNGNQRYLVDIDDKYINLVLNKEKTKYIITFSWKENKNLNPVNENIKIQLEFVLYDYYAGIPILHYFNVVSN